MRIKVKDTDLILKESGGHRWQGYSGKKVHTSTVTVAVLDESQPLDTFSEKDVSIIRTKDSGKGGQHRNKTESCIVATHIPTGLTAKSADRKQGQNLTLAINILRQRVNDFYKNVSDNRRSQLKRQLLGTGQRGDKIKTYREQDDVVIYHLTNEKRSLKSVLEGKI